MFWRAMPLLLIALVGVVVWQNQARQPAAGAVALACPGLARGCAARLAGHPVTLGVTGELKPLQAFQLWVRAAHARQVAARFTMEGMDMGFNRYTLRPDAQGVFRASVTLPVCVSGRRDWIMELDIDGAVARVPFVTE